MNVSQITVSADFTIFIGITLLLVLSTLTVEPQWSAGLMSRLFSCNLDVHKS